jgi:hypothetical protein
MGYYLFLLSSVAWYVLPAWIVPLAAKAGVSGIWYLADLWVVRPQMRLFLFVCPPLARWPGPVSGPLAMDHRILFSLVYALFAWIGVRLVCSQYQDQATRVWWLVIYWAACFFFIQLVAFLMTFFGALPSS